MAWDADAFMAEYRKDECDNTRCLNRKNTLVDTGKDLRDAHALLRKIMQRASEHRADSVVAQEIYAAISNYNLGHRDNRAELPRVTGQEG